MEAFVFGVQLHSMHVLQDFGSHVRHVMGVFRRAATPLQ